MFKSLLCECLNGCRCLGLPHKAPVNRTTALSDASVASPLGAKKGYSNIVLPCSDTAIAKPFEVLQCSVFCPTYGAGLGKDKACGINIILVFGLKQQ